MVQFNTTLKQFASQGEKTGWTYFDIPAAIAEELKPNNKKSFRVKGTLDTHKIAGVALLPMGNNNFIMPVNGSLRKILGKKKGASLTVKLEEDKKAFQFNKDLMECLDDEPMAKKFFQSIPGSHQRYFSKWIDSAKTAPTKVKRIASAITYLSQQKGYGEMIRALNTKNQ